MKNNKIYSDCYQTSIHIFNRTKSFPKHLRPTLGRKIEESILDCLLNIRKANVSTAPKRIDFLYQASNSLDDLRTLVGISKDMMALNPAGFSEITELTKTIGKELGGFIKYEKNRKSAR
jgi:four helix bundle protein